MVGGREEYLELSKYTSSPVFDLSDTAGRDQPELLGLVVHRPVGVVELVADDDPEPLVGDLGPQPGRHTGVDNHPDILRIIQL